MLMQKSEGPISKRHKSEQIETRLSPATSRLNCKRHSDVGEIAALIRQNSDSAYMLNLRFFPNGSNFSKSHWLLEFNIQNLHSNTERISVCTISE